MAVIRTRAIILRHTTDREHDRLLTLLTPTGQHRVRARGTKKSVSKLGGSLEPMTEVDINIADGRVVGLVTGSVLVNRFAAVRADLIGLTMGQWWLELAEAVTKPEQPAESVYDLTLEALQAIGNEQERSPGRRWMSLCRRALLLLTSEGFIPPMDVCSVCHQPLPDDDVCYEPRAGFIHAREAGPDRLELSAAVVRYVRLGESPETERTVFSELHRLVESVIHHTLDRPLRSEQVLRSVIRVSKLPKP